MDGCGCLKPVVFIVGAFHFFGHSTSGAKGPVRKDSFSYTTYLVEKFQALVIPEGNALRLFREF